MRKNIMSLIIAGLVVVGGSDVALADSKDNCDCGFFASMFGCEHDEDSKDEAEESEMDERQRAISLGWEECDCGFFAKLSCDHTDGTYEEFLERHDKAVKIQKEIDSFDPADVEKVEAKIDSYGGDYFNSSYEDYRKTTEYRGYRQYMDGKQADTEGQYLTMEVDFQMEDGMQVVTVLRDEFGRAVTILSPNGFDSKREIKYLREANYIGYADEEEFYVGDEYEYNNEHLHKSLIKTNGVMVAKNFMDLVDMDAPVVQVLETIKR